MKRYLAKVRVASRSLVSRSTLTSGGQWDRSVISCAGAMILRDMTERAAVLHPFDVLIGTWATEATHPLVDEVVPGSITFEWLEGVRALSLAPLPSEGQGSPLRARVRRTLSGPIASA